MKTALITTTINVPKVLQLYRKLDPSVKFYVAADEKTPLEAYSFCADILNCEIYSPDRQKELGYECSTLISWNNDSRRDIALLEAVKWGAELVISIDDDMIPTSCYEPRFGSLGCGFERLFREPFNGLQLGTPHAWFDAGQFTVPAAKQRGLAPNAYNGVLSPVPVINAKIGVAQGIILGVPDTDAMTALTNRPFVTSASDILRGGFVVHQESYAVFNSQWTAFRRELAPAFAQFYNQQGRNTDIFAAMLMRRVMRERDLYTYFGPPLAFHARSPRPLFKDLKAEMFGLDTIHTWAEYLDRMPDNKNIVEQCRAAMSGFGLFNRMLKETAEAFYHDVEKIL